MGQGLYASWPVFREALDAAFAAFAAASDDGALLKEVMWGSDGKRLEQTTWSQRALFALEWALAALWRSWGVHPDYVCGHSIGELSAAAVAGVMSLEDGARLVSVRGRLMQALPAGGAMMAVDASEAEVTAAMPAHRAKLSIAAVNGPRSIVLSGELSALTELAEAFAKQGIRNRRLSVSHAFHSDLMTPMLDEFRRVAETVSFREPSLSLVSNLTGELVSGAITNPEYWVRHVREAVRFGDGLRTLHACGVDMYLELGPKPTLLGLVPACLPEDAEPRLLASLRPELSDDVAMLTALGHCHTQGRAVTWSAVFPAGGRRIELPSYPWQRERHWIDPLPHHSARGQDTGHPLLGVRIAAAGADAVYETTLSLSDHPWLADHGLGELVIMPGTGVAELVRAAAENYLEDTPQVQGLVLQAPLVLENGKARRVQVVISDNSTRASVYSQPAEESGTTWTLHATADIALRQPSMPAFVDVEALRRRCARTVDVAVLYEDYAAAGLHHGPVFRGVRTLISGTSEALGEIRLPAEAEARDYGVHPALLDAALHVVAGAAPAGDGAAWVPFEIGQLVVYEPGRREALVHARRVNGDSAGAPVIDITVMDAAGAVIAEVSALRFRRADALLRQSEAASDALYQLEWTTTTTAERSPLAGRWLVVSEDDGAASGGTHA
jgi:polyketide synthase 12/epothilone polyketide synthase D